MEVKTQIISIDSNNLYENITDILQVKTLIIDPIPIDKNNNRCPFYMMNVASAKILLSNNTILNIPKNGGTFDISHLDIFAGRTLECKLYIYERQPNDPKYGDNCYFHVKSEPIRITFGVARMQFKQVGIGGLYFCLVNS